eukprot:gene10667-11834_t
MKRSWLFLLQCAYLILSFHLSCTVLADDALVMQAGQDSSFEDFYEDEEVNQDLLREIDEELRQEGESEESEEVQSSLLHGLGHGHGQGRQRKQRFVHASDSAEDTSSTSSSGKGGQQRSKLHRDANPRAPSGGRGGRDRMKAQTQEASGNYHAFHSTASSFASSPSSSVPSGSKKASLSDHAASLENKISDGIRRKAELDVEERLTARAEEQRLFEAFRVPRKHARAVERINALYEQPYVDLYAILGASNDAESAELRKRFLSLALLLHPDKNPHPGAGHAFDAVKDAYNTLSSKAKRADYDALLQKRRKVSLRHLKAILKDSVYNLHSRLLLLFFRFRQGRWQEEVVEWRGWLQDKMNLLRRFGQHLVLLPSFLDRITMLAEVCLDHRLFLLPVLLAATSCCFVR